MLKSIDGRSIDSRSTDGLVGGRPPIDPRLSARRSVIRRAQAGRRLRVFAALAVIAALTMAGYGITRSPLLDADRLAVVGSAHTPAAAILAAGGLARGDALVDIDGTAAARAIERLPWVGSATVR